MTRNEQFLSLIDQQTKSEILEAIAVRYSISSQEAYVEITDIQAEHLLDYLAEPQRSATSVLMQRHGLS